MAAGVDISLIGNKQMQRKLRRLGKLIQKKIVKKALREGARPVLKSAQANAPVDTGLLKRSLKLRVLKTKRGGDVFGVGVMTGSRDQLDIAPDDPYYSPTAVEFGHGEVPAQPFMRPAMDMNRQRSADIIADVIKAEIKKAVRGG